MMRFDPARQRAMQAQALSRDQVLADDPAGFFDGAGTAAVKGAAAGAAQTGSLLWFAAGAAVRAYNTALGWQDELAALVGLPASAKVDTDWLDAQRDTALNVAHAYKPDPASTGLAGQVLFDLSRIMTQVAGGAGAALATGGAGASALLAGAATTGAATTYGKFDELKRAGIDEATALQVAAIEGITTGAGVMVPAALGFNVMRYAGVRGAKSYLGANVLYGAGANIGMGVAQRGMSASLLQQNGYADMAAHYKPLEASAMMAEGALGAIFGAVGVWSGLPYRAGAVRDAALAATQAKHAALDTAPGIPADAATAAMHARALNEAIEQVLGGKAVHVAGSGITEGNFVVRAGDRDALEAASEHYHGRNQAKRTVAIEPIQINLADELGIGNISVRPMAEVLPLVRSFARERFAGTVVVNEIDGSEIHIPWQGIKHSLSGKVSKAVAAAATQIDTVIRRAQPVWSGKDKAGRQNLRAAHFYDVPVMAEGIQAEIRVVVRESNTGRRYYDHFELKSESPAPGDTRSIQEVSGTFMPLYSDIEIIHAQTQQVLQRMQVLDTLKEVEPETGQLTPQAHAELLQRFEAAGQVKPRFDAALDRIAQDTGATLQTADIKSVTRAVKKVVNDYNGNAARIKDLVRATLVAHDAAQLADVLQRVQALGWRIKRDNFSRDGASSPTGYRDALVEVNFDGFPAELQISTPEMMAAKNKAHPLYVKQSEIERKLAREKRAPENSEQAELDALIEQQREIYAPAWEATMARNSASLINDPLRQYESRGNLRPPGTSQATTRQFGDWDTGISSTSANRVPSGKDSGSSITGITDNPPDASLPLTAARAGDDLDTRAGLALLEERGDMTVAVELDDGQTAHIPLQDALRQAEFEATTLRPDTLFAAVQCGLTR